MASEDDAWEEDETTQVEARPTADPDLGDWLAGFEAGTTGRTKPIHNWLAGFESALRARASDVRRALREVLEEDGYGPDRVAAFVRRVSEKVRGG